MGTIFQINESDGSVRITKTSDQLILGTTRTVTLTAPPPASSSRTVTIPDLVGNYDVVGTIGTQSIGGSKTFSSDITLSSNKHLILTDNTTDIVTLAVPSSVTSYTFTLPATGGTSNYLLQTDGSGTLSYINPSTLSVSSATTAGTVTGATQSAITSVGTLTSLTTSGSITLNNQSPIILKELTANGTDAVTIEAPNDVTTSYTLKLPVAQGGASTVLSNDGSGNLSWATGGIGTVNSGTQYQLAYYPSSTNVVSGLSLLSSNQMIVSDSNGLPTSALTACTNYPTSFRNFLINGDMVLDQRKEGGLFIINAFFHFYNIDQWVSVGQNAAGVFTTQRLTTSPPPGYTYYAEVRCTTTDSSPAAAAFYLFYNRIEGINARPLYYGTANAKTVTLSFWVRSSLTGTFGGALRDGQNDSQSYPFTYVINSSNTWEYKTITIPGATSGTWSIVSNSVGLDVMFDLGSGSNHLGTAGSWNGDNDSGAIGETRLMGTLNATLDFTAVQFEIGPVATPFEVVPWDVTLKRCQRYYEKSYIPGTVAGTDPGKDEIGVTATQVNTTTTFSSTIFYKVPKMSDLPIVTIYDPADGSSGFANWWGTSGGTSKIATSVADSSNMGFSVSQTVALDYWVELNFTSECPL